MKSLLKRHDQKGLPPMTLRWARTFKTLVALIVVCTVGMLVCGFLSSRGNTWESFTIALAFGMSGSMAAALALALVYYVKLRIDLRRHFHGRAALTDSEFIALSPALKGVDPVLVYLVRQSIAKEYRSIGGDRYYPGDDLDADLHLADLTLWGDWLCTMAAELGIDDDDFERAQETVPIQTFGDLILFFNRYSRRSQDTKASIDKDRSHPVWDRALDG
jgi:hypothetical protein